MFKKLQFSFDKNNCNIEKFKLVKSAFLPQKYCTKLTQIKFFVGNHYCAPFPGKTQNSTVM